ASRIGSDFWPARFGKLSENPHAAGSSTAKTAAHPVSWRAHFVHAEICRPRVSSHDGNRRAELRMLWPAAFRRQKQRALWLGPGLHPAVRLGRHFLLGHRLAALSPGDRSLSEI